MSVRRTTRVMLAFLVGRGAFGLAFLLCAVGRWPTFWYLPLERRWVFARELRTVAMDWYGRSAFAMVVGLAAGLGAWWLGGSSRVAPVLARPVVLRWVSQLGATLLFFDVAFYALTLLTREIEPIPLPGWYLPR